MLSVHVFGDSHSRFFFPTPDCGLKRLGIDKSGLSISGEAISAASLAGFRPKSSTLGVREKVVAQVARAPNLVLAFGQVDLELGYYYRMVVKNDSSIEPVSYVSWLIDLYRDFIVGIDFGKTRVALKGVNLTVLKDPAFNLRYISRIISKGEQSEHHRAALKACMLTEERQNRMAVDFNRKLLALATELGLAYFDINDLIQDQRSVTPKIAECHCPAAFDHHLADTLFIRRAHILRMKSVLLAV